MLYDQKNSRQTPHATLMAVFGKDFSCFKAKLSYKMTIIEVCFMTKKIVVKLLTLLSWLFLVQIFHVLKLKK